MMVPRLLPERQTLRVVGPRSRIVALLLCDGSEPVVRHSDASLLVSSLPDRQAFLVQGRRRLVVTPPARHPPKLADTPCKVPQKVQLSGDAPGVLQFSKEGQALAVEHSPAFVIASARGDQPKHLQQTGDDALVAEILRHRQALLSQRLRLLTLSLP